MKTYGTAEACRLARLDRAQLNAAIFRGSYVPPETLPGVERQFNEYELLRLFLFARYLDLGIKPATAATQASIDMQEAQQWKQEGQSYDLRKEIMNRMYNKLFNYPVPELAHLMSDSGNDAVENK